MKTFNWQGAETSAQGRQAASRHFRGNSDLHPFKRVFTAEGPQTRGAERVLLPSPSPYREKDDLGKLLETTQQSAN